MRFCGEIMKITRKNIVILCSSIMLICAVTYSAKFLKYIDVPALRIAAQILINLLNGFAAWFAMKKTGMTCNVDFRNRRQYIVGAAVALALSVVIAVIPALCGFSLVGEHTDFSWISVIYDFLFYLLVIGPVEEFVFRVYLQDAFMSFFQVQKWLGVVISAFLFGLWHIINGNIVQVLFTFAIGLVFGFAKYKIKDCSYVSVAFGHGLYDFMNTLVRMFLV